MYYVTTSTTEFARFRHVLPETISTKTHNAHAAEWPLLYFLYLFHLSLT